MQRTYSYHFTPKTVSFRCSALLVAGLVIGIGLAPCKLSFGAVQLTNSARETPDPYFNEPLKPRKWSGDRTPSNNDLASTNSDFNVVLPNQLSGPKLTNTALGTLSSFDAEKKPEKGPMILPPLKQAGLWVTPKTGNKFVTTANHESRELESNFPVAQAKQVAPTPTGSIIRERQNVTPNRSFSVTPVNSNQFSGNTTTLNSGNDFKVSPIAPTANQSSSFANTETIKAPSSGFGSSQANEFNPNWSQDVAMESGQEEITTAANDTWNSPAPNQPTAPTTSRQHVSKRIPDINDGRKSFEPSKVLAIVGGEPIFLGDMMFEINQLIERFLPTAPEDVKQQERKKLIPRILPKFVDSMLLYHGMLAQLPDDVDIEKVLKQAESEFDEKALDAMIKNSGLKSSAEFDAHLRAQGSSIRNLRKSWARDQLTKFFLGQQLQVTTEVTHQQMLDEYRKNFQTYEIKSKARWEQLMIRFDRSDSPAAARKQIAALGDQVVYGANFEAVAKKGSHGFMASQGGQHDWTSRNALVLKEIDDAIFALPIGELSDIIATPDGYHIVRVIERTDDKHTPFLEAQVEIKKRILEEKRKVAFDEHLAKLKKEIPVEYPFDPDALIAESGAGTQMR